MSGGENISCPQCRRLSDINKFEPVDFTATNQWDQLLEIAQQFAAMEGQLGPDTSEEEEEENLRENFIDDGNSEARFVAWPFAGYFRCAYCGEFVARILRSKIYHLVECRKTNPRGNTFYIRSLV
jgi:phage FluMu protein Com